MGWEYDVLRRESGGEGTKPVLQLKYEYHRLVCWKVRPLSEQRETYPAMNHFVIRSCLEVLSKIGR